MVSVDEHTNNVIEIAGQGAKLTEELILKMLKSLIKLFEENKGEKDFVIDNNTIEGKQKIKDLVKKHKDGVMSLDDNITKDQVQDYQKEFKKMGVDFSIVKNSEDSYSFFFASRDVNVIEKSLKNIVEKKSIELENKHENELGEKPKIQNVVSFNPEEKQLANTLKELSPQEQALFMKINEIEISNQAQKELLNDLKKGLSEEQVKNVNDIYKENIFTGNSELPKDKILASEIEEIQTSLLQNDNELDASQIKFDTKQNELNDSLDKLSPKEKVLYEKMNELDGLKSELSIGQIDNVQNLHSEIVNANSLSKEDQLGNIFKQLSPEEKDLFMQTNKLIINPNDSVELNKYIDLRTNFTDEQIDKVDKLHNQNIHDSEGQTPKGKIHMNDVQNISDKLTKQNEIEKDIKLPEKSIEGESKDIKRNKTEVSDKEIPKVETDTNWIDKAIGKNLEKDKQTKKEKSPMVFSLAGVKEIDKQLKENEKNNDKDKKRDKELSR